MSNYKMAVVVIHGMGSQFTGQKKPSSEVTFSRDLHRRVSRELGAQMNDVAWREIVWAHVLQDRQNEYLRKIKRRTGYDDVRNFVVHNLSDAASYRKTADGNDAIYEDIHAEVDRVMEDVRRDVGIQHRFCCWRILWVVISCPTIFMTTKAICAKPARPCSTLLFATCRP